MIAYCPTCRTRFTVDDNPPYAVIHTLDGHHLHPLTREELEEAPEAEEAEDHDLPPAG